jgi:hypothetical protein
MLVYQRVYRIWVPFLVFSSHLGTSDPFKALPVSVSDMILHILISPVFCLISSRLSIWCYTFFKLANLVAHSLFLVYVIPRFTIWFFLMISNNWRHIFLFFHMFFNKTRQLSHLVVRSPSCEILRNQLELERLTGRVSLFWINTPWRNFLAMLILVS